MLDLMAQLVINLCFFTPLNHLILVLKLFFRKVLLPVTSVNVRAVLPLRPEEASRSYNLIAITASSGESIEQAMPINSTPEHA